MIIRLDEAFQHLSKCFKCVKIRTLAVLDGETWVNYITSITFTMDDLKEETISHPQDGVMVIEANLPFYKWQSIKEVWQKKGRIDFSDSIKINLVNNFDLDSINLSLSQYDLQEWPAFRFEHTAGQFSHTLQNKINKAVTKYGYEKAEILAKYKLGVSEYVSKRLNSYQPFIEIVIPIFSKIEKNTVQLSTKEIQFNVICHKEIKSVQLNVEFINNMNHSIRLEQRGIPPSSDIISEINISVPCKIEDLEKITIIKASLLHQELGVINDQYVTMRELIIKSGIIKPPLFAALNLFLSKDFLKEALLNPGKLENKRHKVQDEFEINVCRLLAAAGIPIVWLGKNAGELKTESRNVIGSADALAYDVSSGTLFIIECKSSMIDSDDIDKINTTTHEIKDRLSPSFSNAIDVIPIIFTSQIAHQQKEGASKLGVQIIDKPAIEELLTVSQTKSLTKEDILKVI